ncbi:hypothetical protein BASA50_010676 [Batrachochytrium salamandrivorans]|uniref:Ribosomal protein L10 n=1 Tax=Batrachochytrium salamandrivorans TaxID=1357716 RepID=A0ABQ8EXS8_9FUNG|nr:hypothetical protein BASA50_010676 [Batrachochytrium salamandrivorans]
MSVFHTSTRSLRTITSYFSPDRLFMTRAISSSTAAPCLSATKTQRPTHNQQQRPSKGSSRNVLPPSTAPHFHQELPPALVSHALATMKRTRRGYAPAPHRLFWYTTYQQIAQSRIVFVVQNNNMTAQECREFKLTLGQIGFQCLVVRNGLFNAAVQSLFSAQGNRSLAPLGHLAVGPTMVVFSNLSDAEAAQLATQAHRAPVGLLAGFQKAVRMNKKLVFVGGVLDRTLLTSDTFAKVLTLPSLAHMHGEILGLLQMPAQQLVEALAQTPATLLATLKQHESQMK